MPRRHIEGVSLALAAAAHQTAPTLGDCMAGSHSGECVRTEEVKRP